MSCVGRDCAIWRHENAVRKQRAHLYPPPPSTSAPRNATRGGALLANGCRMYIYLMHSMLLARCADRCRAYPFVDRPLPWTRSRGFIGVDMPATPVGLVDWPPDGRPTVLSGMFATGVGRIEILWPYVSNSAVLFCLLSTWLIYYYFIGYSIKNG